MSPRKLTIAGVAVVAALALIPSAAALTHGVIITFVASAATGILIGHLNNWLEHENAAEGIRKSKGQA